MDERIAGTSVKKTMIQLMEFRFRQGLNMVLEMAFSGKFHWEMLFKENIDHHFLGTSNS